MPGDNFKVEVISEGRQHFETAVRLAWTNCVGGKATHYVTPIPAGPCPKCCGTGKHYHWKEKVSFEFPCEHCKDGRISDRSGIVLLWHEDDIHQQKTVQLPFPLDVNAAVDFLWSWLQAADLVKQPDHDGSNGKGFIVTTGDFWGHVEGSHYAFIGVYPDWQMYGK
jgi:hypothetical protein